MKRDPNTRDLFDKPMAEAQQHPHGRLAQVVAFPLARCVGDAREVAEAVLKRRTPASQQAEFERACKVIGRSLRAAGIPTSVVTREIEAFTRTVNLELLRLQRADRRLPGGAA